MSRPASPASSACLAPDKGWRVEAEGSSEPGSDSALPWLTSRVTWGFPGLSDLGFLNFELKNTPPTPPPVRGGSGVETSPPARHTAGAPHWQALLVCGHDLPSPALGSCWPTSLSGRPVSRGPPCAGVTSGLAQGPGVRLRSSSVGAGGEGQDTGQLFSPRLPTG